MHRDATPAIAYGLTSSLLLLLILSLAAFRTFSDHGPTAAASGDIIPGRYIVVLKDDQDPAGAARLLGGRHAFQADAVYEHALRGFAAHLSAGAAAALSRDPAVVSIEPDRAGPALADMVPTGVDRIDAEVGLSGTDPAPDADIAVIDTGVDIDHSDLRVAGGVRYVWSNSSCGSGSGSFVDDHGHGTLVAGIAAARDNDIGVVGVIPGARVWSVKVADLGGNAAISCIIQGVDWVTANADTIEVANMSLQVDNSPALCTAIANSVADGVIYAVAAGNRSSPADYGSPANCPDAIAVSAIADSDGRPGGLGPATWAGTDDRFADFSNYGAAVDIAAPGVNVYSTARGDEYALDSGTSMASPHVAGAVVRFLLATGYRGSTNGPDVIAALAAASWAVPQDSPCGFTGDADGSPEPLLAIATDCPGMAIPPPPPSPTPAPAPLPTPTPTPTPAPTTSPQPNPTPTPTPEPTSTPAPPSEPVDSDGDGVLDSADNCPAWSNPAQTPPPWPAPANDPDCDGFASPREEYQNTNPLAHCPATSRSSDENPDAWSADADDDQDADTGDFIKLFGQGQMSSNASQVHYSARSDFDGDGDVDVGDVLKMLVGVGGSLLIRCTQA